MAGSHRRILVEIKSENILDEWMLSRLNESIEEITTSLDSYRLDKAARPINDLIDDMSNWYIRRSRRRFWKSEDDTDKKSAYQTLHLTLLKLCQLLAPFAPFLTDYIWQELVVGTDLPSSVHLSDWPKPGLINQKILNDMAKARDYITIGLAKRAEAHIKVRQPLESVTVPKLSTEYENLIAEELNVKQVLSGDSVKVNTKLTPELKREGLIRDVIRYVQSLRKEADLKVDARIKIALITENDELKKAIHEHSETIKAETLALEVIQDQKTIKGLERHVLIEGTKLEIILTPSI